MAAKKLDYKQTEKIQNTNIEKIQKQVQFCNILSTV